MRELTFAQALNEALHEEMDRDENVVFYGEDVGVYEGVFKVSKGLQEKFGSDRCFDTPISEAAIVGSAVGASIAGLRPVVEIMAMDWISIAIDALINQATMIPHIWDGQVKVSLTLRTQGGAGSGGGSQHCKSLEAFLYHIPGLKLVMPSNAYDVKGLLKSAIREDNPIAFVEHKLLYATKSMVPDDEYTIEIGKAEVKKEGSDVTIIGISKMVNEALIAASELEDEGISVEVIDPRTIKPLDMELIAKSVSKTGRVVIANEAFRTGSISGDISARIVEECFDSLDGPIVRVTAPDTHVPFSPDLEKLWIPNKDDIKKAIKENF